MSSDYIFGSCKAQFQQVEKKELTTQTGTARLKRIRQPKSYYLTIWKAMVIRCEREKNICLRCLASMASSSARAGSWVQEAVKVSAFSGRIFDYGETALSTMQQQRL